MAGLRPAVVPGDTGIDAGSALDAGTTVDTQNDPANCGRVDHRCPPTVLASGQTTPKAIVLDDQSAYWINASTVTDTCPNDTGYRGHIPCYETNSDGAIVKVSLNGGDPVTLVSGRYIPVAIAVDAANVYWTEARASGGALMKVPRSGGAVTTLVSGSINLDPIAVDGTNVYFVERNSVEENLARVSPDGGPVSTVAKLDNGLVSMAFDATNIYWTTVSSLVNSPAGPATNVWWTVGPRIPSVGFLMKAPLAGGSPVSLATVGADLGGIALDGTSVFFAFNLDSGDGIATVPLDGGTPTLFVRDGNVDAVAIDGAKVYWNNIYPGTVMSAPTGGGSASTLASGQPSWGIAAHSTSTCWTSRNDGLLTCAGTCRAGVCR